MLERNHLWRKSRVMMMEFRREVEILRTEVKMFLLLLLVCLVGMVSSQGGDQMSDRNALLAFKYAVDPDGKLLDWGSDLDTCQWTGIGCDSDNRVAQLYLAARGLVGGIPDGTLGVLDHLYSLSLHSNDLNGSLPEDITALGLLQYMYFHENDLSGELPSDFTVWPNLVEMSFAHNQLTGNISDSIEDLELITGIFLEDNLLTGPIPNISVATLRNFNVANNNLSGPIPVGLQNFSASSFEANFDVCGPPTNVSCTPPATTAAAPHSPHGSRRSKISKGPVVGIVVGSLALLGFLVVPSCFLLVLYRRKQQADRPRSSIKSGPPAACKPEVYKEEYSSSMQEPVRSKLIFVEDRKHSFDLEDLLRASAEVLGKGSLGTAYKAVLEDGSIVTVKRLKDISTGKSEFDAQIAAIARLKHRNLVPLRAYYFSKDEKLLVNDYMSAGSLSALLHGSKGTSRQPLDWISRVRIATGAARALAFLHSEKNFIHGNIKSSNVLLTPDLEACVADYGLAQLLNFSATNSRIIGYKAPEVLETRKVTQKSDVYSFGVLLLELLTGKAPLQINMAEEGIDLPRYVQSVVREEWTAEVFDVELMKYQNIEEEMVQMLQIAMQCVLQVPDQRPKMDRVVELLEDIRQYSDSGNENADDSWRSGYDTSIDKPGHDLDVPSSITENPSEEFSVVESETHPSGVFGKEP